jgi:hypothetical protein
MKPPFKKRKKSLETVIEDAIIKMPGRLGFPNALAIRNYRIANEESGAVDLILFPKSGPFRVVLVEAKVATAADAGSKVVGQLLMYYGGALTLGLHGIEILRKFAKHSDSAHSLPRTSPQKVLKEVLGTHYTNVQSFKELQKGKRLTPKEIALFVALNNDPHHVLRPLIRLLRKSHNLDIRLVLVRDGKIKKVRTN